jgi:alkanesulfonate monooxygenase SsuD/methylene tetrahydromethanopterin reductase-like flavin-dependent oxidoreductase (luciferase family)
MWPVWPNRPDSTGWRRRSTPSPTTSGWRTEATTPSIRYRNPYLAAKALASLDKLSGGRVVAGMAAGYLRSEFTVLGADWDHRGALFDDALDAMRAAWSGETVEIGGPFPASGHTQLPLPSRVGGPPVWIGGNSGAARRRVADKGDGWMPIAQGEAMAKITRTPPLESIAQLAEMVADIERRRAERGGGTLDVCFAPFGDQADPSAWSKQIRRDLPAYVDAGVTWLMIEPYARSLSEFRDAVAVIADEVVAGSS